MRLHRVPVALAIVLSAASAARADEPSRPGALLDVPFVAQTEALCGGASVAMVQRFWGAREVSADDFASLVDVREKGIPASRLANAVHRQGWQAFALNGTPDLIRHHVESGRPIIALLQVGTNRRHYVVVVSWSADRVLYHDPASLPFRTISPAAFDRLWAPTSRWMLLLLPPQGWTSPETTTEAAVPESAAPLVELAGAQLLQHRYTEAIATATEATRRAPDSAMAWRVLATGLFLADRPEPALAAWNEAGDLRLDAVKIDGLRRTRYGAVEQVVGLSPGTQLTTAEMRLAKRRLEDMPALSASRLEYVPTGGGLTEVRASVLERPAIPDDRLSLAVLGARAAIDREVEWTLASPSRNGETITASWRWWESRPRVALSARIPVSGWANGVVGLAADIEHQEYGGDGGVLTSRRRSARASFEQWALPNLRWGVSAGVERWLDAGTFATVGADVEQRALDDRVALGLNARFWPGSGGFSSLSTGARWRSSDDLLANLLLVEANAALVSDRAPEDLWPGAGTGNGRSLLLRAHPLLDAGIVRSEAFGRQIVQTSAEWRHRLPSPVLLRSPKLQLAGFVDAARAWKGPATRDRVLVDVGAGLRVSLLGQGGVRIDYGHGLTDGANAASVGVELPWPRLSN
jgi:hypothetical protein